MKALLLLSYAIGATVLALGRPYDYGVDVRKLIRRDDNAPITVDRLPLVNGTIPRRMEIRDMKANKYKWDLYILALSMFQYVSQGDPLSYYQVAGIHGVPFQAWNGVDAPPPGSPAPQAGYCPHSAVLFPTWHRPYLVLFEQEMYKMANVIASMFTNSTERIMYQRAASEFRIPYWDWSIDAPEDQTHFPDVFWNPSIAQRGPNGVQHIRNPLYSYPFHPLDEDALVWLPLKVWNETKRAPDTSVSTVAPPSRNEQVNSALLSKLPSIQQRLYILFSSYREWNSFSNKAWAVSQNLTSVDSVESIHDIIHIYGGSKGHMTYVPLSSFDPLFFLHHAMTDRLVAMWQILNKDSWIVPMAAGEATFTTPKGTMQSSNTPLSPFLATKNGMFWDSDMARTTEAFGYVYADTDRSGVTEEVLEEQIIRNITNWWAPTSPIGMLFRSQRFSSGDHRRRREAARMHQQDSVQERTGHGPDVRLKAQNPPVSKIIQDGHYTEWVANVHVHVEALDGSFGVHFFIEDPPVDAHAWEGAQNHVGSVGIFAMNRMTGSDSKISGTVPLTSALMKMVAVGAIRDLSQDSVVPYLQRALKFRVLGSDGQPVSRQLVDGLYVGISSSNVKVPKSNRELPQWGPLTTRVTLWP